MSRVVAVVAMLAAMAVAGAANAADKLVLQLNGPAQFEYAGYYAALWQGFYRDAGLEVEIKPGAGSGQDPIDPVRAVTEGRAQFGTGTAGLVIRAAQGLPLLLLAPIFQRSGAEIYYRADEDYASPGSLAQAKVGRLPASDILDIEFATALKAEGVDPDKLNSLPLKPGQTVAALAEHSVDAAPGSAWVTPWRAHEKRVALKSINPADYRVEFYGDTLFTLRRLATAEPAVVRGFRAASLKGWDYALQHPDEIIDRMLAQLPHPPGIADPSGFDHYQAELARRLARFPGIPLGHSNPDRWDRIEASMIGVGALLRTPDSGSFLYDPDAAARRKHDRRTFAILGATLLVALLVTLWFWRRWRRRPITPAAKPAAAEQAAAAPASVPTEAEIPADLNAVLARSERTMRQRVPGRSAFRLSLLPELWRCRAEPEAVRAMVLDLVAEGAGDIKGAGGELIVGTRNFAVDAIAAAATPGAQPGEYVRVTVRDSGPGLAEDALDRVLDRARTTRQAAAAAGEALRAFGGFARVESAEGVGTAVHLYLPRVVPAGGDAPKAEPQSATAKG